MTDSKKDPQIENDNEFAALFEQSISAHDNFEAGDKVTGTVAGFTKDSIFVDISGKSEAVIPAEEFRKDDGTLSVKVGDKITAYVVASGSSGIELTSCIGRGRVNPVILKIAKDNDVPVEGVVTAKINGGFSISIDGMRAFCPLSQIDRKYSNNDSDYLNKKFQFAITELKGSRDCVVSRRTLLEKVQKESEEILKTKIKVGDIIKGTVTRIAEFGIFVDIGGIEGLVPRAELSRSRLVTPDNYSAGIAVSAKILSLDWSSKRFSLSIKETEKDPWEKIPFSEGETVQGTITNIIKGGAFAELVPGLEGFIPVSRMSFTKRISKPEDAVIIGETVSTKISAINQSEHRISLELVTGETDPWADTGSIQNVVLSATIESVKPVGLTVRLESGLEGFVPRGEIACERNADITKLFKTGDSIKLAAKDIRKNEKKLILSQREVEKREEHDNIKQYLKEESSSENSSLGTIYGNMFDELKKKMNK